MAHIVRRRGLGRTSCREIARFSQHLTEVLTSNLDSIPSFHWVFRWGVTGFIGAHSNETVNVSNAIHAVADKAAFRQRLARAGLAPVYIGDSTTDTAQFILNVNSYYDKGIVVRPRVHSQGRHTYLCHTASDIRRARMSINAPWYASEFIDKVAEYRVFICQGRVVWVAKKTPGNPHDVAWNVARGGSFANVRFDDWPLDAIDKSIEAMRISGLDFGGVDIMLDGEDNSFVLEINSAPSQTSPYRQRCVAQAFDYIVNSGSKNALPFNPSSVGWRKYVHPAVNRGGS